MNGKIKTAGVGTLAGLLAGGVAFIVLTLNVTDRLRGQGSSAAGLESRLHANEAWIADYEKNIRPLRDQFIAFTGELPGLRREMADLKVEVRRLSERLDRFERRGSP